MLKNFQITAIFDQSRDQSRKKKLQFKSEIEISVNGKSVDVLKATYCTCIGFSLFIILKSIEVINARINGLSMVAFLSLMCMAIP